MVNINTASVVISGLFIAVGAGIGAVVNGYSFPTAMGKVFSGFMRKKNRSGSVFDPMKFISRQPDGKTVGKFFSRDLNSKYLTLYFPKKKPQWNLSWKRWTLASGIKG